MNPSELKKAIIRQYEHEKKVGELQLKHTTELQRSVQIPTKTQYSVDEFEDYYARLSNLRKLEQDIETENERLTVARKRLAELWPAIDTGSIIKVSGEFSRIKAWEEGDEIRIDEEKY